MAGIRDRQIIQPLPRLVQPKRKESDSFDKKPTVRAKKEAFCPFKRLVPLDFPQPGVAMSLRKPLSLNALVSLAALAACSDITGPDSKPGFCPITGGSGTCDGHIVAQK